MVKKYLKKIIAESQQDLQVISACCEGGKIKVSDIKLAIKNISNIEIMTENIKF